MKRYSLTMLLSLVVLLGPVSSPATSETINFENLKTESASDDLSSYQEKAQELWSGSGRSLYFETGLLDGQLLTVSTTPKRLFISTGQNLDLLQGDIQRRLPGRILYVDLHSIPDKSNFAVITLTYLSQQTLKSSVFSLQKRNGKLKINSFYNTNWALVRPVGNLMYRQQYDANRRWVDSIEPLETTVSSYTPGDPVDLPAGTLLSALMELDGNRWAALNTDGHLLLSKKKKVLTRVNGTFGATVHRIQSSTGNSEATSETTLRLPPVYLDSQNSLIVMQNQEPTSGLMSWFYGRNPSSSLVFFTLSEGLEYRGSLGPLPGRILDYEIPEANPNQLLVLRRTGNTNLSLEMIEFKSKGKTP